MLSEVSSGRITTYAAHFPGLHLGLVLASIAAGNTAAQLWVTKSPVAPAALLWDKGNNVCYLAGTAIDADARDELARLVATQICPRSLVERSPYFKAHALSAASEAALHAVFSGIELHEIPTHLYGYERDTVPALLKPTLDGVRFVPIDQAFLHGTHDNLDEVRAEIRWMWLAEERFYEHGFGVAALVEERVICWCTAEYVGAQTCGIGITTVVPYERRGIASATAARFVAASLARGITPYWECRSGNIGSRRVAEKVGFSLRAEERYWGGVFAI